MQSFLEQLKRCAESHTFDTGDPDNRTVLDQLFCAYQDSHETDPPEIKDGFTMDLSPYFLDGKQTVIKNTSIFDMMVNLLH